MRVHRTRNGNERVKFRRHTLGLVPQSSFPQRQLGRYMATLPSVMEPGAPRTRRSSTPPPPPASPPPPPLPSPSPSPSPSPPPSPPPLLYRLRRRRRCRRRRRRRRRRAWGRETLGRRVIARIHRVAVNSFPVPIMHRQLQSPLYPRNARRSTLYLFTYRNISRTR